MLKNQLVKAGKLTEQREQVNGRIVYRVSLPSKPAKAPTKAPRAATKPTAKPRARGSK